MYDTEFDSVCFQYDKINLINTFKFNCQTAKVSSWNTYGIRIYGRIE